jgi:hypothetical protein
MKAKIPFWSVLIFIVLTVGVGFLGGFGGLSVKLRWLVIIGLMLGFLVLVGFKTNNRWDGVLIDSRFKMSLARFQMLLWTLMIFSAFFTFALERDRLLTENLPEGRRGTAVQNQLKQALDRYEQTAKRLEEEVNVIKKEVAQAEEALLQDPKDVGVQARLENARVTLKDKREELNNARKALDDFNTRYKAAFFEPLNIVFPNELLLALGISTASLAGASIIKNIKREKETGKSLELTQAERDRFSQNQRDAQKRMAEAIDTARKLITDENTLEEEKKNQGQTAKRLEEEVNVTTKEVERAEKAHLQKPEDAGVKTKLENARANLKDKQEELGSARKTLDEFKKRYDAAIENFSILKRKAANSEDTSMIAYERATEELKRIDDALSKKQGLIHRNEKPEEADWSDLFRGDEVSNYQVVDVSKVQMFFFTIAIVFTYGVMIWLSLTPETLSAGHYEFPVFSESMNTLLGLSHAGYLAVKSSG